MPGRSTNVLVACATCLYGFLFALGCVGTVSRPGAGASSGAAGGAGSTSGGAAGDSATPPATTTMTTTSDGGAPLVQPTATLHKLTIPEFTNSLHDLLGTDVPVSELEPDHEVDGFRSIAASIVSVSPLGIARYETAVDGAAAVAFASAARAAKVLACLPANATDTACATRAINAFGRRAFRRPLTDVETTRYLALATATAAEPNGDLVAGLREAVSAIPQSPSFLYRVELGAPSAADGGRTKYTGFEMASRLAAMLWATVPDDALLDAAANGALATPDGVRAQAQRMISSPKAHQALSTFVDDLYGMDHLAEAIKDPKLFPAWTDTLREAMHQELLLRIDDVAFDGKSDFLSLYDQKTTFVNNELAKLYGLPVVPVDGFRRIDLPAGSPRQGVLGSGALLAAYALPQRTSPTTRGKFVMETLLCRTVPPPPPGVNTNLDVTTNANAPLRQQLEAHRQNATCAACHGLMDPVGLGLENFDSVGAYRLTDKGATIDASGLLDGVAFANAAELGSLLRNHANAGACVVRNLYTAAQGRTPLPIDAPVLTLLATRFSASGRRADQLLVDVVSSDAFRFVQVAAQ